MGYRGTPRILDKMQNTPVIDASILCDIMLPSKNQHETVKYVTLCSLSPFFNKVLGLFLISHLSRERLPAAFSKKSCPAAYREMVHFYQCVITNE